MRKKINFVNYYANNFKLIIKIKFGIDRIRNNGRDLNLLRWIGSNE